MFHCLLRSRGTFIAHYACRPDIGRFSHHHRQNETQCLWDYLPQPKSWFVLASQIGLTSQLRKGLFYNAPKSNNYINLTSTYLREAPYSPTDSFGLKSVFFTPDDIRSFLYLTYILYHIFLRKSRKFLIFNPKGLLIWPWRISHLLVDLHNQTIHYHLVDLRLFPSRYFLWKYSYQPDDNRHQAIA